MRRFAAISPYVGRVALPERATTGSAGYDLAAAERCEIAAGKLCLVPTGLKVYLGAGECLAIFARSSLARRHRLILANGVGLIDADYVDNADNEGHILVPLWNLGQSAAIIEAGERVAQGVFLPYLLTAGDMPRGARRGGFGSTGF